MKIYTLEHKNEILAIINRFTFTILSLNKIKILRGVDVRYIWVFWKSIYEKSI